MSKFTYVILVNWKGEADTLECLESVFRLRDALFRVIVCDNGSADGSLDNVAQWAEGARPARIASEEMSGYSLPPLPKPIACQRFDRERVERDAPRVDSPLVLVDCKDNLGFAGGNNVGLRLALAQPDMARAWLLNNDTVVNPNALKALCRKMEDDLEVGIAGSTVVYYDKPDTVQAFGGARYFPCLGLAMHIGRFQNRLRPLDERRVEKKLHYIMGASMMVSRAFLEQVGLMSEDYFLYYEELDWALRGKVRFKLGYAGDSLVFHKAGSSIGSSNKSAERSLFSDRYLMGNRIKITEKFFPYCSLTVRGFLLLEALIRMIRGKTDKARMIWELLK